MTAFIPLVKEAEARELCLPPRTTQYASCQVSLRPKTKQSGKGFSCLVDAIHSVQLLQLQPRRRQATLILYSVKVAMRTGLPLESRTKSSVA